VQGEAVHGYGLLDTCKNLKGRYHAASRALANSRLPAHTSMGLVPLLYIGGLC